MSTTKACQDNLTELLPLQRKFCERTTVVWFSPPEAVWLYMPLWKAATIGGEYLLIQVIVLLGCYNAPELQACRPVTASLIIQPVLQHSVKLRAKTRKE